MYGFGKASWPRWSFLKQTAPTVTSGHESIAKDYSLEVAALQDDKHHHQLKLSPFVLIHEHEPSVFVGDDGIFLVVK